MLCFNVTSIFGNVVFDIEAAMAPRHSFISIPVPWICSQLDSEGLVSSQCTVPICVILVMLKLSDAVMWLLMYIHHTGDNIRNPLTSVWAWNYLDLGGCCTLAMHRLHSLPSACQNPDSEDGQQKPDQWNIFLNLYFFFLFCFELVTWLYFSSSVCLSRQSASPRLRISLSVRLGLFPGGSLLVFYGPVRAPAVTMIRHGCSGPRAGIGLSRHGPARRNSWR
jgi:hypothetical protein